MNWTGPSLSFSALYHCGSYARGSARDFVYCRMGDWYCVCHSLFTGIGRTYSLESLGPAIRTIIAAVLICVLCVFAIGLLGTILRKMLEVARISAEDRVLGSVFGFIRGVVFVCAVVF